MAPPPTRQEGSTQARTRPTGDEEDTDHLLQPVVVNTIGSKRGSGGGKKKAKGGSRRRSSLAEAERAVNDPNDPAHDHWNAYYDGDGGANTPGMVVMNGRF